MQRELFVLKLKSEDPPDIPSADCDAFGIAVDGHTYAIKTGQKANDPLLPANEWICTNLAEMSGIAVPTHRIIERSTGTYAFGSRWEGGVEGQQRVLELLTGKIAQPGIDEVISRIYAFDLFIHNIDRHPGNYLARKSHKNWALVALDYSRSLLHHNWPNVGPGFPSQNTHNVIRVFQAHNSFHHDSANQLLDTIESLPNDLLLKIMDEMPDNWISVTLKNNLDAWWRSSQRSNRINDIKVGLKNGKYL